MSYEIRIGDLMDRLQGVPDNSVHCVVTSPPYWGLRDYGIPGRVWGGDPDCEHEFEWERVEREMRRGVNLAKSEASTRGGAKKAAEIGWQRFERGFCKKCGAWHGAYGLEPTVDLYVEHTVEVFREIRRVLRTDGTCWLNIGDSYTTRNYSSSHTFGTGHGSRNRSAGYPRSRRDKKIKRKELAAIPHRVVVALQEDGWWYRQVNILHKTNSMPESAQDRPSTAHEFVFLLSKRSRYFYDEEAVKVPVTGTARPRGQGVNAKVKLAGNGSRVYQDRDVQHLNRVKQNASFSGAVSGLVQARKLRSVWTMSTQPYKGAHFATFPVRLPRLCILAGTSAVGVCPTCGAPWKRVMKRKFYGDFADKGLKGQGVVRQRDKRGNKWYREHYEGPQTIAWQGTCSCDPAEPIPATVLDPFSGAASTGIACLDTGRDYLGIELNEEYVKMSLERLREHEAVLARPKRPKRARRPVERGQQSLFR